MPLDINSFGVGGEGLSGLFMGQQMAQQQFNQEAERDKIAADIANTQEITRQRQLANQATEALQPDAIAAQRLKYQNDADEAKVAKYTRGAAAFGKMGAMMESIPAAARPAAIRQMASAYGIGDDDPMLGHLMSIDPAELPKTLTDYSTKLYEQSDLARKQKQGDDAAMAREVLQRDTQREIARGNNATTLEAARIAADSRLQAANARGAGGADGNGKETFANYITRIAREKVADGEWTAQEANEYVQRAMLANGAVRVPDTAPAVMSGGTPTTAQQRVEQAVSNSMPGAKPVTQQKFEEGKIYQDASGNKARFRNGKWEPIGGSGIPH